MTEQELALWLRMHGGEVGRKNNERQVQSRDEYGRTVGEPRTVIDSTTIEAADGATLTLRRVPVPEGMGPHMAESAPYERVAETPPDAKRDRTPEQRRTDEATARQKEFENEEKVRENNERSWNQNRTDQGGSGRPETHRERAEREAKERQEERQQQELATRQAAEARATAALEASTRQQQAELASREREGAANRGLTQQQIDETRRANQARENQPTFLSQADTKTPTITRYNPATGQIESFDNPNYDAVKAAAEEKRAELAAQIAARKMNLEEAQQQYTQWFDANVRVPMMQSQEVRARAEERRAALEAEERRRQFAADFKLRKATLGETAAQRATSAEISLLPYRAGPMLGQQMSSAINSLAQGGRMDTNAAAGINFTKEAFEFSRPDFKRIAKDAAKAVLSGLTDYRPSDDEFPTGDYSGIPSIASGGSVPAYQYTPTPLPAPSEGAMEPIP